MKYVLDNVRNRYWGMINRRTENNRMDNTWDEDASGLVGILLALSVANEHVYSKCNPKDVLYK
jgi:hypothetical protein